MTVVWIVRGLLIWIAAAAVTLALLSWALRDRDDDSVDEDEAAYWAALRTVDLDDLPTCCDYHADQRRQLDGLEASWRLRFGDREETR